MLSAGLSAGNGGNISASFGMSAGLSASSAMIMASSSGNLGLGLRYKVRRATETASLAAALHMAALPVIVPMTAPPAQALNFTSEVTNGIVVTDEEVNLGGRQNVSNGGIANGTRVPDGTQTVYVGGVTNGTRVNGGFQFVSSGGTANETILTGGLQRVARGGVTIDTIVSGGSQQLIGGKASGTTLTGTGVQQIRSGGSAGNTTIISGGKQYVFSGTATNTNVLFGGEQNVSSGGSATETIVSSGGTQNIEEGGFAENTTVSTSGQQYVSSGGSASETSVQGGGSQNVKSGGVADGTTIERGGTVYVSAGGTANDAYIRDGGELNFEVVDGADTVVTGTSGTSTFDYTNSRELTGKTIYSGISAHVRDGGKTNGIILDGGHEYVWNAGSATSTTVTNGGEQHVSDRGSAAGTTVTNSGNQYVSAGGSATGTTVTTEGTQHVLDGASVSGTVVTNSGNQTVYSGGSANGTTVSGEGIQDVVGGFAENTIVNDTGQQIITSNGSATGTHVGDGGTQQVLWGKAENAIISSGGYQYVSVATGGAGTLIGTGSAMGAVVQNGGMQEIQGGIASDTTVDLGGLQIVDLDGSALNNTVYGSQVINSGGMAYDNEVHGSQFIDNGGLASGVVAHAGGIVEVVKGGIITGDATFGTGSTLKGNATVHDGYLSFADGSTLEILIREPANDSDRVTVTGSSTVTIDSGANLNLAKDGVVPEWTTGKSYTIIDSETRIDGLFGTVDYGDVPISPFVTISQEIIDSGSGQDLILIAEYNGSNSSIEDGTDNQKATNTGVDCLPDGHAVKDAMINAAGAEPALELLDQLSGEAHKSISNALASHFRTRNVDTLFYVSWAKARPYGYDSLSTQPVETPLTPTPRGNGLWVDISGAYASIDGNSRPVGTAKAELYGPEVALGYDYRSPDGWIAGGSFRYGDLTGKVDRRLSEADIDSYNLLVYGGKEISLEDGVLRLALGGAYGYDRVDMSRKINAANYTDNLNTSYGAHSYQVFGEAAYAFTTANMFTTEPFVNLSWDSRFNDSFCESGGPAALCSNSDTQNTLMSIVGVRGFVPAHERVSVAYELGWVHTYGSMNDTWNMGFCDGACNYDIRGAVDSRDAAKVKVGVGVRMTDDLQGSLVYNGLIGGDSSSHGGTFRITWSW